MSLQYDCDDAKQRTLSGMRIEEGLLIIYSSIMIIYSIPRTAIVDIFGERHSLKVHSIYV